MGKRNNRAASGAPLERADGLSHLMQVQEVEDIRQALSAVLGGDGSDPR